LTFFSSVNKDKKHILMFKKKKKTLKERRHQGK